MIINISQALKYPGKAYEFKVHGNIEDLDNTDIVSMDYPIAAEGSVRYVGDNFFLTGSFEVNYTTKCSLCEALISNKMLIDFDEEYSGTEDLNHPDRYTFIGDSIDLKKMVRDNIYLNLPMKNLCSDECLGLCSVCGCNLNEKNCDCESHVKESLDKTDEDGNKTNKNNPFAGLANMFKDEDN